LNAVTTWKHIGTCVEGQRFEIEGLDVWSHKWICKQGESASVKDPQYGQAYTFHAYEIITAQQRVTFAAGEFSNAVFGFYTPISN
jgi:hypothetical protein